MKHLILVWMAFAMLVAGWGQAAYTITDLGFYDEPIINNRGEVAGQRQIGGMAASETLIWRDGIITALGVSGRVEGINDAGMIVGVNAETDRGFIWQNGSAIDLAAFPGQGFSNALGVNNAGTIMARTNKSAGQEVYLWDEGVWSGTGVFDVGYVGTINDFGAWVGAFEDRQGFMAANGGIHYLPGMGPADINDRGQVVGQESLGGPVNGLLWDNGVMHVLPFSREIDTTAAAKAINSLGQIVGDCSGPGTQRAVLWQNGRVFDLNSLAAQPGWLLLSASDINDRGQIVGRGYNPDGVLTSFLLTPDGDSPAAAVPEPTSVAVWLLLSVIGMGYGSNLFVNQKATRTGSVRQPHAS